MTPVSVFFSAQIPIADFQRPLCQQLQSVQKSGGFGEAPQQAFLRPSRAAKIASVATLALLAGSALPYFVRFYARFAFEVHFRYNLFNDGQKNPR